MLTVGQIAQFINGKVIGNGDIRINGLTGPSLAGEGDLTFAMDEETYSTAEKSGAVAILTNIEVKDPSKTLLYVENIKEAVTILYNAQMEMAPPAKGEIHPRAVVSGSAVLGENVSIGANTVIGDNVRIGDFSKVFPNVTIYDNTIIGSKVIIHSGCVIGADGFGYIPKDGKIYKVPQLGRVVIKDNVEIGSNTSVDRGTFTDTVIGENTKIDNLCQISHNVKIGKNVFIAALSGIAGSAIVGDGTMMGGNVGIADHVRVGNNVKIGGKTGVHGHVKDNAIIFGYPFRESSEARKLHGIISLMLKRHRSFRKMLREMPE